MEVEILLLSANILYEFMSMHAPGLSTNILPNKYFAVHIYPMNTNICLEIESLFGRFMV